MSVGAQSNFSDYIIFVDESGDHGLTSIDPNYPIFVLVFCIMKKDDYVGMITPALEQLKFKHWGHDAIVLHEHEIRKPAGEYLFLLNENRRSVFMKDVEQFVDTSPFILIASIALKQKLQEQFTVPASPYNVALEFGLERVYLCLKELGQEGKLTHVIVERRGSREDAELELIFRRICDGSNYFNQPMPFHIVMTSKLTNLCGLQLADLIARPIGIKILRPNQPNRAYDIIEKKMRRSPQGVIKGWGIKVFP